MSDHELDFVDDDHDPVDVEILIPEDKDLEEGEEGEDEKEDNADLFEVDYSEEPQEKIANRRTRPYLTKYEKARVIGVRALQINQGAPSLIETTETNPLKIAQLELRENKIPLIIRRYFPNGSYEDWNVTELKYFY